MTTDEKLDKVMEQSTDIRLAVAALSGEVRSVTLRLDGHEATRVDFETRLRALERRMYAIPSLAAVLSITGLVVALWDKIT